MFWYEDEIKRIEDQHHRLHYSPKTIFYGSSSIRMWDTLHRDFAELMPVNLGFGGSTLAACVWFFDRVMKPYNPARMIIYAGDNDLGDGRHPEEVFIFFRELVTQIHNRFGRIPCYFISLKPSPSRWHLADQFRFTNTMIENEIDHHANWQFINIFQRMLAPTYPSHEYFVEDGLHLSERGYELWKEIITESIASKT